jgi:hypothetical protein
MLINVSRLVAIETPAPQGEATVFHVNVDFQRQSFYTDAKYVGQGHLTPRFDFETAIRQFII